MMESSRKDDGFKSEAASVEQDAIKVSLSHDHFAGGTVQSNSRISIEPESAGSTAALRLIFWESTVDMTFGISVARTSHPIEAKVSLEVNK